MHSKHHKSDAFLITIQQFSLLNQYICEHNRTCKASNEVMIDHRSFWRRPLRISDLLKFEWDSYWIFFFKWWVKLRLNASSHLTWKISDFSSLTNWKLQVSWVCMSSRKSQKKKSLKFWFFLAYWFHLIGPIIWPVLARSSIRPFVC